MQTGWLIGRLEKAAAENDEQGLESVCDALIERGEAAVPSLIGLWSGRDYGKWRLYKSVTQVIVGIGEGSVPHLIEALGRKDVFVPGFAMEALAAIGLEAVPELVEALVHGRQKVRRNAADVLNRIVDGCGSGEELLQAQGMIKANICSFGDAGMLSIRQDAELVADQLLSKISGKALALGPQRDSFMECKVKPPRKAKTGLKAGKRQLHLFKG